MPFYHEPPAIEEPSIEVVVGGSIATELDWVLLAASAPAFRRDHATLGRIYEESPRLGDRVRGFWDTPETTDCAGSMELAILAHHGGILFSLDADELLDRLEGLCADAPEDLRLASETPRDREAMRSRLARLRSSGDCRRAYVELMRDVWAAVRPDWVRNGRRSVEFAVAARREIQRRGASWEEIARSTYRPGGRVLDDLVASLPGGGVVAVVPAYFAHLGSLVDLPGTVMIGVRAEGSGAEARARTENLARRLKTISDPTRLAIVEVLRATPSTVSDLAELFSLAQPTISNHVKILRDAGIVANGTRGGRRELVLQHGVLDELLDHLEGMLDPARQSGLPGAASEPGAPSA
ncbi:MAG: metalloregulator ArsR/SmtB family transcription factor [Candidatus Dormibacteria bacterium]|jgi:DNA-binding transcriptional ArsR family regulator